MFSCQIGKTKRTDAGASISLRSSPEIDIDRNSTTATTMASPESRKLTTVKTVHIELQPDGRYYEVRYIELQSDAWGRVSKICNPGDIH